MKGIKEKNDKWQHLFTFAVPAEKWRLDEAISVILGYRMHYMTAFTVANKKQRPVMYAKNWCGRRNLSA